jgi:hypothetical protein
MDNINTDWVKRLYDCDDDSRPSMISDYGPLLNALRGQIIIKIDDHDYQGDSYLLYNGYDGNNHYGILIFGWGSCSGCDALLSCDTWEEVETLRKHLEASVKWGTKAETLAYLKDHDWQGDALGRSAECEAFRAAAIAYLEALQR